MMKKVTINILWTLFPFNITCYVLHFYPLCSFLELDWEGVLLKWGVDFIENSSFRAGRKGGGGGVLINGNGW